MYVQRLDENCVTELCAAQILIDLKSCIQELVDNAIDAKSNEIKIRVVDHGTKLIEIIDDGEGMTTENLKIACLHNSTSKIKTLKDLSSTRSTLGFRGEALSALANMSDLTVTSRTNTMDLAARVTYDSSGKIKGEIIYEWRPIGTCVLAENLFSKFPVRLIQMEKESKKQVLGILQLLTAYSLIHCHIRFVFVTQSVKAPLPKTLFSTQGNRNEGFRESCSRLFGRNVAQSMIDINFNHTFNERIIIIQGLLTSPCLTSFTSCKNIAFLFVNRYYIVSGLSKFIRSVTALYQNYNNKKIIPHYILNIQIPHNCVDYNVTTTKQKVFVSDMQNITDLFLQYLRDHFFLSMSLVPKTLKIVEEKAACLKEDNIKVERNEKAQETSQRGPLKIMAIYNSKEDFTLVSTELCNKKTQLQYSLGEALGDNIEHDEDMGQEPKQRNNVKKDRMFTHEKKKNRLSNSQEADVKQLKTNDLQLKAENDVAFLASNSGGQLKKDGLIQLKENEKTMEESKSCEKKETFSNTLECKEFEQATVSDAENSFDVLRDLARKMIHVQRCEWMKVDLKVSDTSDVHVLLESCLDEEEGVFVPSSHLEKISLETKDDLTSPDTTFFFPKDFFSSLKIIGQFNKGFIICSLLCCNEAKRTTLEIFVVDQHATDEKYKYEELCFKTKETKTQALVQPLKLNLSSIEKQKIGVDKIVLDNLNIFRLNGFYIQEEKETLDIQCDCEAYDDASQKENVPCCKSSTPSSLYVHGLPLFESQLLDTDDILDLINKLHHQECICYNDESHNNVIFRPQKFKSIMATKACRSAIMIGDELSYHKMVQIVQRMISMQHPWACPHGRPTLRHLCSIH